MILGIKRLIFQNLPQKVLALFLSILFWMWIDGSNPKETKITKVQYSIPITYINLPKSLEITSRRLQSTIISVNIPQAHFQDIHPSQFQAVIDLEAAHEGSNPYVITKESVVSPSEVQITSILPNQLEIEIEKLLTAKLPIEPVLQGSPAKGYVLESVKLLPSLIEVQGPESSFKNLEYIETKAINVENLKDSIDMVVHLDLPPGVGLLGNKEALYTVRIKVGSQPLNRRFDNIPISKRNEIYVTQINPRVFNVLLRGPKSILEKYTADDIPAAIDLKEFAPGEHRIKLPNKISLPAEIQILKAWPPIDIWVRNQKVYEE